MKAVYIVLLIVAVVVAVIAYAALVVASRCSRLEEMQEEIQDPCAGCIREHICTDEEKESCPYCRGLTREG